MRTVFAFSCALIVLWFVPTPAAAETLDIQQELSQPGVKLVVVEFYATWCKPCMEAVPKWKALHDKYRKNGLRFIVVSAESEGMCGKPPDWAPDRAICDEDGTIQKQLGMKRLPQSFLFSWQGSLSMTSHEVGPIRDAIENFFKHSQLKMVVDKVNVIGDKCAIGGNPEWLRNFVAGKIREQSKFDVVSVSREGVPYGVSETCSPDLPPNSVMRITLEGDCRGNRTMTLAVEKDGCTLASTTGRYNGSMEADDRASMEAAATAGISNLTGQLIATRAAKKPKLVGKGREGRIGYVELAAEDEEEIQEVVVKFESDPAGAVVLLDGKLLCAKTPCSKLLGMGRHEVMMQAENYLDRREQINALKGLKVSWKLDPDFGLLSVTSDPVGLDVKLDGEIIGKTPIDKKQVSPRAHEVLVVSDCHYEAGERVVIERGQARTVAVTPIPKTGKVKVKAQDKDGNDIEADVYIDGFKVGTSPGTFKVNVCAKEIEVKDRFNRSYKSDLRVAEKQIVEVAAVLKGGFAGGNADLEWVYSNPANLYFTRSEVTVSQYERCVSAGACESSHNSTKSDNNYCNLGYTDRGSHPMNCVDWYGAEAFCKWAGGRLPTEDEWYAEASNGKSREYPWGNQAATCNYAVMSEGGDGCGRDSTWPVCSKPEGNSVSGLCDMSGNVWEWTSSPSGSARVVRGGGWSYDFQGTLRASGRYSDFPVRWYTLFGFRCVRSSR